MPFLPLSGIIGQMRVHMNDTDSNDPAMTDSVCTGLINKWYLQWHYGVERRITEVTATTSGYTFTSALKSKVGTPTNWYEVVEAYRTSAAGNVYGVPLEIVKTSVIARLQNSDATPAAVTRIAFSRGATASSGSIGKWTAYVHPIPDATYTIGLLVRQWPEELSASTDTPDITELGAHTIARLAAADGAAIFGEDREFIDNILRPIPDEIMAQIGMPRPGFKTQDSSERAA